MFATATLMFGVPNMVRCVRIEDTNDIVRGVNHAPKDMMCYVRSVLMLVSTSITSYVRKADIKIER